MKNRTELRNYLWDGTRCSLGGITTLTLLQSLLGASTVLYAILLQRALDAAAALDTGQFQFNLLLIICLFIAQNIGWAAVGYLSDLSHAKVENYLKERLYSALLERDYAQVTQYHSGEWMNRLTSDVEIVGGELVDLIPDLTETAVRIVAAVGMLLYLERRFAYILLLGAIILPLASHYLRKRLKKYHKEIQESNGRLRSFLQEWIESLMVVKAFSAEEVARQEARSRMEANKAVRLKRSRFYNFSRLGFSGSMDILFVAALAYGGFGILNGHVTYGMFAAMFQLVGYFQTPITNISRSLPRLYAMTASAERLMEAESFERDVDLAVQVGVSEDFSEYYQTQFMSLVFDHLSFAYSDDSGTKVLENLNLIIRKGDFVALTGESGQGKSTLLKLLMCLYPVSGGAIKIQERGGEEDCILTANKRGLFAYVPQGNNLMTGTIREVVSFTSQSDKVESETADSGQIVEDKNREQRIRRALHIACADRFVDELEIGIDTQLGEHGAGLSEGQLQRLAIARAIYRDSPILLLDEVTSALDEDTERHLLSNLKELTDKTVLIVTHRPAALKICNRIVRFTDTGIYETPGWKATVVDVE